MQTIGNVSKTDAPAKAFTDVVKTITAVQLQKCGQELLYAVGGSITMIALIDCDDLILYKN